MAVETCRKDNRPGFRSWPKGYCYTYKPGDVRGKRRAREKALDQLQAIIMSVQREEEEKKKRKKRASASILKVFGAIQFIQPQPVLTLADWYIGASRARELADYALGLFDTGVSSIPTAIPPELKHRIDIARDAVESTVLSWEDERLGPKTEEGIPYSTTGRGAKARYKDWIKDWIEGMTKELERLATGAQLVSVPVPPTEPPPVVKAPIPTPEPAPAPEIILPVERKIAPKPEIDPEFLRRVNEIAGEYPMVIRPLREEFIRQAMAMLPEQDLETALRFLRRQFEYIKYVGEKKYGAAIPIKRIFGD